MSSIAPPLFDWLNKRSAGLLIHPTCLPSNQGVGVLDDESIDALFNYMTDAGLTHWQICPLGPTGYGDSPYQCFSAFAGNPYLIDLEVLVGVGLLESNDLVPLAELPTATVDFGRLYETKWAVLSKAYQRFCDTSSDFAPYGSLDTFIEENAFWLKPYGLFQALKRHHNGQPWTCLLYTSPSPRDRG